VAEFLGFELAKQYSAVDWSIRPLPSDWLRYAALDVELLLELRDAISSALENAGKLDWALAEFQHVLDTPPPAPRRDPWRKTSGTSKLRDGRQLAVVRNLWYARDRMAKSRDVAPKRILSDEAIIAAANMQPRNVGQLVTIREFSPPFQRRRAAYWQGAIDSALALPSDRVPSLRGPGTDGPPKAGSWPNRNPEAAERLAVARAAVQKVAARLDVPVENLLQPDNLLRLCWEPPAIITPSTVADALHATGARDWQIEQVAVPLATALSA
jgi:ribonuclease D